MFSGEVRVLLVICALREVFLRTGKYHYAASGQRPLKCLFCADGGLDEHWKPQSSQVFNDLKETMLFI